MVLILDGTTYQYVFSLLKKPDVLRLFSVVTKVDSQKAPQPSLNALYLLSPSNYSIKCLLSDFEAAPVRYKGAHLWFLPTLSPGQVNLIKLSDQLTPRILSFENFPLDIHTRDSNVFTVNNPQSLQIYYNNCCSDLVMETVKQIASSLVGVCELTGEYPIIRYYSPSTENFHAAILPKMIASEFQAQLDNYARKNPEFPPVSERPRSIFLITDRTCDLYSPLLHEFTYQAMAYDSLDIDEDGRFTYEVENEAGVLIEREATLDEEDSHWVALRNLHISDAEEFWKLSFKEFTSKYSKFINRSGKVSVSDIRTLAAGTEEFNEARKRIVLHDKIIISLLKINNERNLAELAEFEQDLISNGCDINGDRIRNVALNLLNTIKNSTLQIDKLRVLIIYCIYRGGLIEEDLVKLFHFIEIPKSEFPVFLSYFENLEQIGFTGIKKKHKVKSSNKRVFLHESATGDVFNTSRFKPAMSTIVTKLLNNTLDETLFPYIKDKPIHLEGTTLPTSSLKNPKHRAAWGKPSHNYEAPKQRVFYFIAGGATLSEVRTALDLSASYDKNIILGSDEIYNPEQYLSDLKLLSTNDRKQLDLYHDRQRLLAERPVPNEILRRSGSVTPNPIDPPQSISNRPSPQPEITIEDTKTKDGKRSRFKKFLRG